MVLKTLYIIELTDTEEGGLELVDPSWSAERDAISMTATSEMTASSVDFDMNVSDQQSEFSEWSGSRKSSLFPGPEEGGPPRKKVKSPPVISPTGSSTSIYSGGSSSIDWTTTGTTLEMQGTRVTRTQYGFRTLQESSAKMCLKVTGYPLPDITWYKDDVQLHEDERHTFYSDEDGFFAMTIDPVQVTDTGRYTCMATNEYGQASTSAFFRVLKVEKEAAPPAFVTKLKDKECKEGDVIDFECEVEGWPEPELVWLVDDQPLRPSHDFRLQYDGQTAKLEIRDAQPDDTGVYTVKIQNEFGSIESKAELFVQADPDKNHVAPEFQAMIEDVECDEGEEVRFKSVITGDPNPEITWFINGKPLSESEKVKFISEDGICILTIKDVTRHFDGMVTCQGSNRLGSASCDGRLKVRVPPAPPTFNKPLEDKTVQEKSTVVFEVDVSGWPEPTVTFTLCGKELKHGEEGVEIVGHDGFYRISIPNTSIEKHDGEIVAKAQNEHGTAESRARLTVEQEEEESRSAPTFLKDIEDQTVKTGEFAVFETTVRGNPNPEVTWFINGHKMDQGSPGVKIEAHNHDHKLTIDSAQYAGTVLCRAENAVGRFETKARLIVLAPEKQKKPPKFVEILVDKTETVDNTVVFEVRVEGEPKPTVTWYLKGEELKQSDRVEIREFDGSIKLQIKNIKIDEAGEIKAVATNSEGSDETRATLTVQKKPFAPEFDLRPKSLTVEKGSEAVFTAHAFGIPLPTYEWSINGRKVRDGQEGARVTRDESTVDGASILTIDTATYYSEVNHLTISVVAENTLGAEETGAQLTIEPKKESVVVDETDSKKSTSEVQTSSESIQLAKEVSPEATTTITMETSLTSTKTTTMSTTEVTSTVGGVTVETKESESATTTGIIGGGSTEGSISVSKIEVVSKTESQTDVREGTPKRRVSFAEEEPPKEVIDPERKKKKSPTPEKKEKSPVTTTSDEKPKSPTKKEKTPEKVEEKPKSPTKKEKSPEKSATDEMKSPTKKEKSPEKPTSPTKKNAEEAVKSPTIKEKSPEKSEEKVKSPTKKEKSPVGSEEVKSPTKKEKSPEAKNIVEVSSETTIEKTETTAEVTKSSEEAKSPTKKEKSPEKVEEKPKSPTKKEKSPEKPTSPTKKTEDQPGSPVPPKSPTKIEEKPSSPTQKKSPPASPKKAKSPEKADEKPTSPIQKDKSPEQIEKKPTSPTKKEKSPEKSTAEEVKSPIKKEKSPEKSATEEVKSPTKKEKSPEKPTSPTKKTEDGAVKSPTKKEKSPEKTEEKPKSPTKKEKSPEKSTSAEDVKSPTKKEKSPDTTVDEKKISSLETTKTETSSTTTTEVTSPTKKSPPGSPKKQKKSKSPEAEKPPAPKLTRDLKSQTVNKMDLAHFEVVVEHATEIKWFLDGKEITTAQGVSVSKDDQFEFRCSIDTTVFGSGVVSVVASNASGSVETKTDLKVLETPKETKKPEFTDKLRDIEVTKGDTVQMDVIALHSPEYKWYQNGNLLEDGKNGITIKNEENKSSLIIPNAQDSGKITVEASNEVGTSESSATLTVNPPSTTPIVVDGPKSVTIKETETAEFKATITGFPAPTVKWTINEKIVEESTTVTTIKTEDVYTLKISNAKIEQTGTVKVTAQNSAGQDTKQADLKVEPNVVAPKFKSQLTDRTVDEGEPLRWNLELDGPFQGTEVTWLLNGQPLTKSDTVQVVDHGDGTYHVTIAEAKPDMSGTLTAKAKNAAGECESSAKVTVNGANKKPEFIQAPQNHETNIEESVKFSAIVTGKPMPNVSWFLNDKKLIQSEEVKVKYVHETGKTSIRIHKPLMEHNGTIRVEAVNVAGKVEATAQLKVDRKTEVPKFTTNMDDRQVKEGDNVKFTANVEGYPEPSVAWTLNGEPVAKHANITVTDKDGEHTIEIAAVTPEQAGELSCEATNAVGSKKRDVQLAVKKVGEAPTFAKNLEDRLVTEGELALMDAKLNAVKPKPKITWLKDGVEIKSDDHYKLVEEEDGTLKLSILTTKLDDKGRITIKAESEFGVAETSASLGVVKGRPMAKPTFQSDIAPINLTEGDTLECKLLITGDPTPFVKWYINGQLVCATEDTEISNANGVYTMKIHGVTSDMTGKIKCVAYNKAGEASIEGPLKVVAPIPVEFETSLCDATCREGDTLKLKAVLLGEPEPVVSWYVNGKKLEESQNIKIHSEKGTYTVTIKDITCDYSGQVVCEAINEYGKATSEATLLVLPRGEPPDFLEWLSNVRARTGTKVVHKVVFTGDPKPSLTWYINNKEILNSDLYTIVTDDKTSTLTINSFNPDIHVGEIICKAENDAGEVSCTANMITYTSDMFSESESEAQAEEFVGDDLTEDESLREEMHRTPTPVMAPKFITKIKDTKAKKGHSAVFECVVPDTKGVCCKWLKDGKEIELIARIRVQTRTGPEGHITQELILDNVTPEDAGKYTCVVENTAGKDTCEATLTVIETLEKKTDNKAPEFIVALQDKTTKTSEKVVLECKVIGEPKPKVSWLHDNKTITQESIKIESVEGVERVTITSTELTHQGKYTCVAENSEGTSKTEAFLTVQETASSKTDTGRGAPEFVELLRSCTVTEKSQAVLKCKVKGEPRPKIKWTKEGKEVEMSARVRAEHKDDGTLTLTFDNVTQADAGEYRCEAENEYGSAWTEGPIIVTLEGAPKIDGEAPDFLQPVKPAVVTVGETAVLEGKISGKPKPTVKWYKNGEELKPSDKVKIENLDDGTQRLTVTNAQLSDMDEYRCEASNEFGDVWSDVTLTVKEPSHVAPGFFKDLSAIQVKETETAKFECKVSGTKPDVKWFKDGSELKEDKRIHFESTDDGTQRLVIEESKTEDQGNYRIEVSNDAGVANSKAPLTVIPAEILKIKKGLNDVSVAQGSKILLSVEVEGKPKTVKWYKGSETVTSSSTTKITQVTDSEYKLEIESGELSDSGSYRVVLSTDSLSVESSATVTVSKAAEKISLPSFKKGLSDQSVPKGTPLVLEVEIEGKPKDVKWYKNGDEIKDGKVEDLGNGKYRLTIPDFKETDVGEYSVTAANEAGEIESKAKVNVSAKPEIVSGLVPTTVKQGETATFNVKVKGPVKGVKWYKNGKEIPDAKTKDNGDGSYSLEIPNAQVDDGADYKVVVSNDAGDADSSAALTVKLADDGKDKVKPEIVSGLVPTTVKQGDTATFNVKVKGPVKQVKWYKNGKEIPDAKTKDNGDGSYSLEIPNAQLDDTADYKVVLSNDAGDADSSAALTVKLPGIEIVKGLEDTEVPKGKKVVLEVETNKKPKEIKWYKNGKEITPNDKAKAGSDGDKKPQLVIPDAGDDDAAEYKVVLTDDDGNTAESFCALTVKLPAEEPKIIKGLEDQVVPIGSPIKLEIETSGSPKIVKWYKNGKELTGAAAKNIKISKIDDNKYVLEIPSSVVEDTGDYKVEVANEAGSANSSGKITVEPKITFMKPLKDQTITEGENAEFAVETNTKPRTVKWYKNGQEIKPDSRFVIEQKSDTKYQLVIKNAVRDDAATYKVVMENTAGEAESSAQLTVKKAKAGLCKIVKGLEDQVVAKGAKMVFEVKIQGEPEDVRWLRDANVISAGANAIIEKIDDTTYRLTIPSADLKDAGEYTVEVINESGKAKSDAKGEVDEKPEIVRGLENIEIPEGDDDVFKVEVSAPVRQVKWYKNGQEIKPNSHLEAKKIGPKKYELAINRAQLDDGADYKVVLSNAAGDCDSSAALTVVKPNVLKIVDGLKDVDVEEPQPVALKVKVEGIPKVVKWYKNGQELKPDADGFKFEEKPESGEFSLLIPSSKKSDGGAYRVVLGNDKGEVYSGSVVHVKAAKPADATSGANFLSPLKDTEVEEGDMLTLQCTVAGEPFPEIIWEKDGVVLQKDDRITMRTALDGTVTLRIRSAKKSDIGQYRVTAKNEAGSASSDCKVTVTDQGEQPSKPKFVIPLRSGVALPGDKKEFNVKVRGLPKPTLKWILNGKPITFDDRVTLDDMADGNYCLTIRDVREEDFGTLKCIATNENGTDETVCEFSQGQDHDGGMRDDLRYPPRFNVPLWDRRIPVGDPMFIECHVDANPTAEIEWFKDGKKIEHTAHTEIRNTVDGACRIKISPFEESDIGVYMCVATNELGQAETQATYQVEILEHTEEEKKKEYAPRINPPLEDKTVNGGQPIRLSCKVDAVPRASVVWYKDGLPIRADSRISVQYEEDGTASLTINESTEADIGAYRCVATNAHGTINTSCSVNVKVPKQEVKKEGEEPFFTKGLVDLWTDRGETFTLKCAVTGDPFPEIKWYRNGQLVRTGPRTIVENSPDGTCSLTVKESTMSDEGIYRCEAENAHGKAKTQATAHVQMALGKTEKPKMDEGKPPKFILELSDMSVSLGNVIDLECKVTGLPNPSVKWSKDGGPLIEDSRFEWSNEPSKGVYQLRIKNATVHDEGTYRCVATNENGSATTKSFVRMDDGLGSGVVTASQPPRFTLKMGDVRTTEGQPLKLECKVDASPLPEMTWYKDGAIVTPSDRIQISLSPDGIATLLIPSCVYDDDGIYRVIATNPSGTAQDKGTATVKKLPRDSGARRSAERDVFDANKAPKLMEPLENIRIPEKQAFRLRCKFSGDPKPTIKWFKDGERVFPYGRLQLIESPDGVCELVVDSATRQDAGGYRCVAENTYGSARTSCDVNVIRGDRKPRDIDSSIREGKAPGFTIPLTIRRAKPGESVTFECLPFGNPFPAIKWLKDGLELFADEKIKMEAAADGTQRLIISDVTFLSEGYFRCVATNEHGTASTKAELVIEGDRTIGSRPLPEGNGEPEECKPRIRRGLYNMSIHEGNVVEMIVCATGIPTPTVKWYKDGQEIIGDGPDGKRVIFTDERGIHHLVIVNASPDDEGDYSLEATNKLGSARTEGSLNIIRPRHVADADDRGGMPFPPGFVRQLKNKHVFNHMPTIFDCLVVGHPAPEVEWFHNGKKIVPGGRIKIQSCGGGSHALIILDTTLEDAGEYVATAKNSHGSASSSAVLDVTVPFLDNIKFNGEIDVTPYLTEEYGFKKLNTASLPTPPDRGPFIKEVTGHYLTLSWIPTKRAPPRYPQVTYVIEIRELPEKEWTLLDYNIPEPVCKVRNLELGKSYQFRVRAENIYGISDPSPASPPSRLMAPPQPVFDKRTNKVIPLLDPYAERALDLKYSEQYACAPWFAPGVVEKRYCAENDTLTIILNVSGFPDPDIKWKFRGWDIDTSSPTSKCKVYTYGGTETTLAITGFSKENVGQYQCFAKNEYGDAQQNILVDLATRPNFIQPLVNKTFSSAQPMRLDVRVEGEPFPELKWMKEWRPIVESSRIKFVQDGPFLCSLIINDPMWRDSGIYSCVAINDAGQATTSCTVTVEAEGDYNDVELPRRRVTIESRRVRELYEISEKDEKLAAEGAPFRVSEKSSGREFLAQLRPIDDALLRHVDIHNSLDHPGIVQMHRVLRDEKLALVVFENANSTIDGLSSLTHPGVSISEPKGVNRETCVRVFVRQLLLALKHMHDLRIAHLDLRPETILLQDDKLKLADFGQARRLLRGLITGEIKGSPEFVSPEIVRSYPLTLATDMWSTGVLTYVLLTGLSPFHGDNDNETLSNVDRCQFDSSPLGNFSYDAGDFVQKLLLEIPAHRLTVDEALDHPWLNDEKLKNEPLSADTLREFKYQHKWLERRVFVQQTPSEQILEAILGPATARAQQNAPVAPEGRRPAEIYDYLRIQPKKPPPVVEYVPKPRKEHPPFIDEFGQLIDGDAFDEGSGFEDHQRRPPPIPPQPQRPNQPSHDSRRFEQQPGHPQRIPVDKYGRPIDPRYLNDPSHRPSSLDDVPFYVDEYGNPIHLDEFGRQMAPQTLEKRKLIPQDKGETPSRSKKEKTGTPVSTPILEPTNNENQQQQQPQKVPIRMIRGERREIEEEIANRILSDISEEGSIAGSLASLEDFEIPKDFQVEASEPSTPTLTPEVTIRETIPKPTPSPSTPQKSPVPPQEGTVIPPKVTYPDTVLAGLPEADKKILEDAENDPSIPVGAPLFLEGLHGADLTVDTTSASGLIKVTSPAVTLSPNPKSPRRSTPGTKSPVMLSPRQEHSMEVLIATKRGKPGFLPPGELAEDIDDEDAFMDDRKKQVKPKDHDGEDDFKDEKDRLEKDKNRRAVNLDDLDKFRPGAFYKDDNDFGHPGYDIDDSVWDSHYQIGPDTYLMAARGAAFNSRVRNYREELFGVGAPTVKQGFLGVRNRDITVRERRRYTDILRESTQGLEPKSHEHSTALLQKAPSATAIERIKADIEKVTPSATKKNDDGTFAPIFTSRLRDVYLRKNQSAIFECSVASSPAPKVTWDFQGKILESNDRIKIEQENNIARLIISNVAPYDLGEYVCSATNEYGTDKTSCRMISGETPSRPSRPEAELSSDTEIFLQWEAPEGPTYLEGITYRLEYRVAGPNDHGAPWITISEKIDDESVVVRHLSPFGIYQFRVTAQNGFGLGLPSLSSRIVQTHGKGAPKLQIDVLKSEIRLNVVSMPQKSANQLGGISEESEEDSEARTTNDDMKSNLQLQTSDPIGRFQIGGLKFKGRFSIIRDAVDSTTEGHAHCAVKIRHPSSDAISEYESLRDGQHENVQRLIAAYNFNNFLYLFSERLYEDVFSRFVFNDYYTEEQVAMTMRQVTSALHFLHFRGIAHLDVNPHNIMFQSKRSWIVKLVDFGRAQKVSSAVKPVDFDTKWASPEFHIPETPVTVQSDMWGMGVVTFCLLAGFHPFTSEYDREEEIKDNVINVKCDPNLIPVNASQECLSFATWALKKSPVRRMRTDEALSHKFLSSDPSMVRRRESIKYSASRLRKLAAMIRQHQSTRPISDELESKYGN